MKKTFAKSALTLAAGALIGVSAWAHADPVTFIHGPFDFKFQDFEFAKAPANGVNVGGIFSVSSINPTGLVTPWWIPLSAATPVSDGTMLNGFFSNIKINSGTSTNFTATGGLLVLYDVPVAAGFNPSTFPTAGIDPTNQLCGGVACPAPWVTALYVPGIGWTSPGFNGTSTVAGTFTNTNPITGSGSGYLSVADLSGMTVTNGNGGSPFTLGSSFVGTRNSVFDTNGFTFSGGTGTPPLPADLFFKSSFDQCTTGVLGVPTNPPACKNNGIANFNTAASADPVTGNVIPEPGSLALLGISIVGLALAKRRRT